MRVQRKKNGTNVSNVCRRKGKNRKLISSKVPGQYIGKEPGVNGVDERLRVSTKQELENERENWRSEAFADGEVTRESKK